MCGMSRASLETASTMFTWVVLHRAPDSAGNNHHDSLVEMAKEWKAHKLMTLMGKTDRKSPNTSEHHFKETRVS